MKKILLALIVFVGLGSLNAGMFSSCKKTLVTGAAKKSKIPLKTKNDIKKCITDPKLAEGNPNFVQALHDTCKTDKNFARQLKAECKTAVSATGGDDEEDDTSSKSSSSKSKGGSSNSDSDQDSSSGGTTCTCICPGAQAPGYAPQPPAYDPYGQQQQQQQYQQPPQYQQPQYQQPQYGY